MINVQTFEMFNENVKFVKQPIKKGAKTDVFKVSKDDVTIGLIKWSSRARGYAFLPTEDCDAKIKEFVKDLMAKRRAAKKKEKLNESIYDELEEQFKRVDPYLDIEKLKKDKAGEDLDFEKIIQLRKEYSAASGDYQRLLNWFENDPRRDKDGNWNPPHLKDFYDTRLNALDATAKRLMDEIRKEENPILKSEILEPTRNVGVFDN